MERMQPPRARRTQRWRLHVLHASTVSVIQLSSASHQTTHATHHPVCDGRVIDAPDCSLHSHSSQRSGPHVTSPGMSNVGQPRCMCVCRTPPPTGSATLRTSTVRCAASPLRGASTVACTARATSTPSAAPPAEPPGSTTTPSPCAATGAPCSHSACCCCVADYRPHPACYSLPSQLWWHPVPPNLQPNL